MTRDPAVELWREAVSSDKLRARLIAQSAQMRALMTIACKSLDTGWDVP